MQSISKRHKLVPENSDYQEKISRLPHLARLIDRGFSLQEARDYAADGLQRDAALSRIYRQMTFSPQGRRRLREAAAAYRELGIEPPFDRIIDLESLMRGEGE